MTLTRLGDGTGPSQPAEAQWLSPGVQFSHVGPPLELGPSISCLEFPKKLIRA